MSDNKKTLALSDMPSEIREQIFAKLVDADNATLLNCRAVSTDFRYWIDKKTPIGRRRAWAMVFSYLDTYADFKTFLACRAVSKELKQVVDKNTAVWDNQQLLKEAVLFGEVDICRLVLDRIPLSSKISQVNTS